MSTLVGHKLIAQISNLKNKTNNGCGKIKKKGNQDFPNANGQRGVLKEQLKG